MCMFKCCCAFQACGFPLYWKILLFRAAGGDKQGFLTLQSFSAMLKK